MNKMSRYPSDCKIYVGDLGSNATKQELEDAFSYYGPLRNVWVARNPPGFAFVEFEDARDAEDAVRGLDGRTICGRRARVEPSNGKRLRDRGGPSRRGGGRPFHPEDRCYECGERGHYARDCPRHRGSRRRRSRSRSRSRSKHSRSRSASRSRSRSRGGGRDRDRSRSKARSVSKDRSPRRTKSRSASRSRSRSRAIGDRNGNAKED
ncbi:serine/arginine-rich splicing factor 7 isoform X2 [Neodiprion pinetum]|uniref:Serine/arginine-rich splicing factor 7 isoform X2 n=1 Tax=Neodiprion lecontei TaxID=441921 RepID=A0ABM3FV59_NEOLC|nr:serine/arginine-rich splicing factor 7-like isoform X2 [Neodiprion fabricii]XP_046475231.1 serine/arginine-rich splicing factor 7-like isoform X2 [Neodiprion pinetum]XP_046591906.1 serine/arginine-rich splicing factor 7 isoform X2 [Neodiprion lecontei]XP_046612811.1 serine/arginine-rich splicing factor 7-like isoform X2 [Neodiprion virginianus]XP_046740077.1 serine/arginine-rich splicing factor 7-like isoform X2 [Diprion similis]